MSYVLCLDLSAYFELLFWQEALFIFALSLVFFAYFPYFLQCLWSCEEISDQELVKKCKELAKQAGFRYTALKVWPQMQEMTAAIMGPFPFCRYVLFSPSLLKNLEEKEILAVFAHEMGHSYYKHLLFYPFLIALLFLLQVHLYHLSLPALEHSYFLLYLHLPQLPWEEVFFITFFTSYLFVFFLYFRFIYGFISRNFERQADLYLCKLSIPAKDLASALDKLAFHAGGIHHEPNWHHFSIHERIQTLKYVSLDPSFVRLQDRKVFYICFSVFFLCIVSTLAFLPPMQSQLDSYSVDLKEKISLPLREYFAKVQMGQMKEKYKEKQESLALLVEYEALLLHEMKQAYAEYASDRIPGLAYFYVAHALHSKGLLKHADLFLKEAYRDFPFEALNSKGKAEFEKLRLRISKALGES